MSTYFKGTHQALGPQGEQVIALIERAETLTASESEKLATAWKTTREMAQGSARKAAWDAAQYAGWAAQDASRSAAQDAAYDAAWSVTRYATWVADAWDTTWYAVWYTVRQASLALVVRDLIAKEHYDLLTEPWTLVIGPVHPEDKESKQ